MSIQAQVQGVQTRTVNGRNGPFEIHEVFINGMPHVAKRDVWEQARAMQGQTVEMQTRTEQKGQYTNYYLDSFGNGGLVGTAPPQPSQSAPVAYQPQPAQSELPAFSGPQPSLSDPTQRDLQIWRQVALKVSAQLSNSPHEFWGNLADLMRYIEHGQIPADGDLPF